MKGRPAEGSEPRDLSREWHSDSKRFHNREFLEHANTTRFVRELPI